MSTVTHTDAGWLVQSDRITVRLNAASLAWDMQRAGGRTWRMAADDDHDLTLNVGDAAFPVSLASAAVKEAREYRSADLHGVRVLLRGFQAGEQALDVSLALIVAIDVLDNEVVARVVPVHDPGRNLGELRYPRPFELDAVGAGAYHALPSRQGCLLPSNWPGTVDWWWIGLAYTPAIYMPWWGALRPGDAYIGILETPYDGGMQLDHPAGGPTRLGPKWHPSMGHLNYARQVRYALFGDADHNALVHRYREYARRNGALKTLETKATELPAVRQLEGTTIAATYILHHTQPDSHYYDKEHPERNDRMQTFAAVAEGLDRFAKAYPSDRVVVHLDGWGLRGYDNLCPDILPPCPDAGGWDGMRRVADACAAHGWLFATHDNYIDYYKDAATYNEDLAIVSDEKGTVPGKAWWAGGAQTFLCEKNALGYLRRNFEEILRQGVRLTATYIDVFSIIELVECYHPDHRMTREEAADWRKAAFDYVRSKGIVLSSEEPNDWSIPHIDFCYWAPVQQAGGLFAGKPVGVPVPLFNGVYHDCIVVPANMGKQGEMGEDDAFLYALAYGEVALVGSPDRAGPWRPGELERAKLLADVHRRTGFAPIDRHELLDADGTQRITTFGGGETIEVDLRKKRFRLYGFKGMSKRWQDVKTA